MLELVRKTAVQLKRALFDKELMYIYQDYLGRLGDAVPMGRPERRGPEALVTTPGAACGPASRSPRSAVERGSGGALRPLTLAEKLLAAHAGLDAVVPGQIVVCDVDVAIAQDGTGPLAIQQIEELGAARSRRRSACSSSTTRRRRRAASWPTRRRRSGRSAPSRARH